MNDKNNFEQKVLEKIKTKKIKPEPKWKFLIKNYAFWFVSGAALVIASVAFSVVLYMMLNNDWVLYRYMGRGFIGFLFVSLPYFWMALLIAFIVAVHYNFKNTKKGYKYRLPAIVAVSSLAAILLGGLLYKAGAARSLDDIMARKAVFYRKMVNKKIDLWAQPEKGLLAGVVLPDISTSEFALEDFRGNEWNVHIDGVEKIKNLKIEEGKKVKIMGEILDNNNFKAKKIWPMGPGRDWFRNNPEARQKLKEKIKMRPEVKGMMRRRPVPIR